MVEYINTLLNIILKRVDWAQQYWQRFINLLVLKKILIAIYIERFNIILIL